MTVWNDSFIAAGVGGFNLWKSQSVAKDLEYIISNSLKEKQIQNENFENALQNYAKIRQILNSPENILGSNKTKHGEIAEYLEVYIRNAKAAFNGQAEVATFNGVGRTAATDFFLKGVKTQSKFINGASKSLSSVLEHFNKYQDKTIDYIIPKDQYDIIQSLSNGQNPTNLSEKSIRSILKKIDTIEGLTGRPFNDVVKQSISNYDEVQIGKVHDTLQKNQEQMVHDNQQILNEIDEKADQNRESVHINAAPSFREGMKVAGTAAVISTTVSACVNIYSKVKSGTKLFDFTTEDWKDVGLESVKTGTKAGVTAASIYGMTNLTSLSAPFAGAVTSAAMGVTSLLVNYQKCKIDLDEVVTQGQILCLEAGIAAVGGAMGQTLIPIPVLGAIIGTVTTNLVWGIAKGKLGQKEEAFKRHMDDYMAGLLAKVDSDYYKIIQKIDKAYARFNTLIDAAFDVHANKATLAAASIQLAREIGVEEHKILKNNDDLMTFFLN
ncbi:hypothetical protein [Paenibacillus sp. An7]|uniref:hypothetical protein n=1 Tax=Paenibacillus sp. An7 TaxID=2689577 RepID=UPI00135B5A82|nr:hypothetical protein [Paenibacillus sp. An7]